MAQPFKGKTAIITGAGSGINLAFATLLLGKGCNVVFADLALRPEAQQVVDSHSLVSSNTGKAVFQKTDVTKWSQLDRIFDVAEREFGGVDLICPGAGVHEPVRRYLLQQAQPFSNFWLPPGQPPSRDSPISNHYALLDINLTHPIRSTQLAISRFLAASNPPSYPANAKSIILISSIAGQVSPLPAPLYNASKHAINGFVRSLAQLERKVGIRVVAVAPGVIKTPLWTDHPEKLKAVDEKVDEWVAPEDVAEVMLALVADEQISQVIGKRDSEEAAIKIQGGTILEVSKGRVRDVQPFNDPGPLGRPENTVGGMAQFENEVWDLLGTKGWGTVNE